MDKCVELALNAGRKFQCQQTGFVHYNEQTSLDEPHYTIPIYENFLFALTLLRTRQGDQIQEAKQLLKNLLPFQNQITAAGNFPHYLHQYPTCNNPYLPIHLLVPFYWILKDFSQVLGTELLKNIQDAAMQALRYSIRFLEEKKQLSDWLTIKIASATQAYCTIFKTNLWNYLASSSKDELEVDTKPETWYIPELLGEILISLQIADPELGQPHYQLLKNYLRSCWHSTLNCYVGPSYREYYSQQQQETTLLHLFMYQLYEIPHCIKPHPSHLKAALIRPISNWEKEESLPLNYSQDDWKLYKSPKLAVSILPKAHGYVPPYQKAYHPLKISWSTENTPLSLVCYGNQSKVIPEMTPPRVDLQFTYPQELPEQQYMHKAYEIQFYCTISPFLNILVNNEKATLFKLEDTLTIETPALNLIINFHSYNSENQIIGHIMKSNRPSQKGCESSFEAYDWGIFLRTVERPQNSSLRVSITWETK